MRKQDWTISRRVPSRATRKPAGTAATREPTLVTLSSTPIVAGFAPKSRAMSGTRSPLIETTRKSRSAPVQAPIISRRGERLTPAACI